MLMSISEALIRKKRTFRDITLLVSTLKLLIALDNNAMAQSSAARHVHSNEVVLAYDVEYRPTIRFSCKDYHPSLNQQRAECILSFAVPHNFELENQTGFISFIEVLGGWRSGISGLISIAREEDRGVVQLRGRKDGRPETVIFSISYSGNVLTLSPNVDVFEIANRILDFTNLQLIISASNRNTVLNIPTVTNGIAYLDDIRNRITISRLSVSTSTRLICSYYHHARRSISATREEALQLSILEREWWQRQLADIQRQLRE